MVNNVSWGSYWSALIVLTGIYYVYILLVYYRSDVYKRLARPFQPSPLIKEKNTLSQSGDDKLLPVAESLSAEMSAYLNQASYAKTEKPEIIFGLQQIAKKYKGIKDSNYQHAISSLMMFESEDKCAVHLSEEEIRQVWFV